MLIGVTRQTTAYYPEEHWLVRTRISYPRRKRLCEYDREQRIGHKL